MPSVTPLWLLQPNTAEPSPSAALGLSSLSGQSVSVTPATCFPLWLGLHSIDPPVWSLSAVPRDAWEAVQAGREALRASLGWALRQVLSEWLPWRVLQGQLCPLHSRGWCRLGGRLGYLPEDVAPSLAGPAWVWVEPVLQGASAFRGQHPACLCYLKLPGAKPFSALAMCPTAPRAGSPWSPHLLSRFLIYLWCWDQPPGSLSHPLPVKGCPCPLVK